MTLAGWGQVITVAPISHSTLIIPNLCFSSQLNGGDWIGGLNGLRYGKP